MWFVCSCTVAKKGRPAAAAASTKASRRASCQSESSPGIFSVELVTQARVAREGEAMPLPQLIRESLRALSSAA